MQGYLAHQELPFPSGAAIPSELAALAAEDREGGGGALARRVRRAQALPRRAAAGGRPRHAGRLRLGEEIESEWESVCERERQ